MQLFLYEWVTGGGLVNHHGPLPESLLVQGKAMIEALAADAAKLPNCQPFLFRDLRVQSLVAERATIKEIDSRSTHDYLFDQLAVESDAVLLLAPETDGVLEKLAKRAEQLGANLISPPSDFIRVSADKQETAEQLAKAGVPVPQGIRLEPDSPLPKDQIYPAVIKPILGAGSEATYVLNNRSDHPPAHAWPRRIEPFLPGMPVSVSLIGSSDNNFFSLPPTKQRLTQDGQLEYLGGEVPLPEGLADRATRLAKKALAAMPPTRGYVGVDLILGPDPYGNDDYVIEINPRLTTSYIGLRQTVEGNLIEAMLKKPQDSSSRKLKLKSNLPPLRFDAEGAVYFIKPSAAQETNL